MSWSLEISPYGPLMCGVPWLVTRGDQESKCRLFYGIEQAGSVMELQMSILINSLCDKSHDF